MNAATLKRLRLPAEGEDAEPNIALQQLTYAFYQTYGIDADLTIRNQGMSSGALYAFSGGVIPSATFKQARHTTPIQDDNVAFIQLIDPIRLQEHWDNGVLQFSWHANFLAQLGALLGEEKFIRPTEKTQALYARSVVVTIGEIRTMLSTVNSAGNSLIGIPATSLDRIPRNALPNINLDTADSEMAHTYRLSEDTHRALVKHLLQDQKRDATWEAPVSVKKVSVSFFPPGNAALTGLGNVRTTTDPFHCPRKGYGWTVDDDAPVRDDGLCRYSDTRK